MSSETSDGFFAHERYGILGAGLSGRAAAALLLDRGKLVTLLDDGADPAGKVFAPLTARGASLRFGPIEAADATAGLQALVVSPGIAQGHPPWRLRARTACRS